MSLPLRALLLSAGYGTRLRPLTLSTPKCLIPIAGKPLLGIWLKTLEKLGCEKILINTHYLANIVEDFVESYPKSKTNILTIYEKKLLGTAGTLLSNKSFFKGSKGLIIHSDNLTDANLNLIIEAHENRPKSCLLTMLTFNCLNPKSCGIVQINEDGIVQNFYEKSEIDHGNRANGALYVFDYELIEYIENNNISNFFDISLDLIPILMGKIYTWHTTANYFDIGSHESLKIANKVFRKKFIE